MDAMTKEMLKSWVATSGNDAEKAAKWAARNMRAIGGIKFWRAAIAEAMQGCTTHRSLRPRRATS